MTRLSCEHGAFEITSLPGQSQVAVCHGFVVPEDRRRKGHAHALKSIQAAELGRLHYDFAVCTVAAGNLAQKAVLAKAGWKPLAKFRNSRSCETTELWGTEA